MTAITIPAAADWKPGVPCVVAVAEGENRWTGVPGMDPDEVPPADWVEKAAAKCETCEGRGWNYYTQPDGTGITQREDCHNPRCHNGRRLWEVLVPCDTYGETHIGGRTGGTGACEFEPECDRGYRTVLALLDVVPVEHATEDDDGDGSYFGHARLIVNPPNPIVVYEPDWDGALEWDDCQQLTPAHVEALPRGNGITELRPGMFALVATVVER